MAQSDYLDFKKSALRWMNLGEYPKVLAEADYVGLRRFAAAINPLDAATAEGGALGWDELLADYYRLPACDCRLVEGAGGLAVPLDAGGRDWADCARAISADAVV